MKNNRFYTKALANIIYSLTVSFIIEVFLLINTEKIASFLAETQGSNKVLEAVIQKQTLVLLLFVFLGIGIFVLVFWFLFRSSLTNMDHIVKATREISEGNLSLNIEVFDDDEFSDIANNLNDMLYRLNELMEKERESEKSKNELMTNIAHDLRTPLTSIIGYLELLLKNKNLSEEQKHSFAEIAYHKAKRLQDLIEELFHLSKLSYGKLAMKVDTYDLVRLLTQLMDEFYPNFEKNHLAFSLESNEDSILLNGDANLIFRLFDNLINNAIKYGVDGKRIDVRIEKNGKIVQVFVTNYGKVIPEEELPFLFEKFYRVEQSRSRETGGTGLGLAIVSDIVSMHGGSVEVKSDLSGTSFIVSLRTDFDINKEKFEYA